MSKQKMSKTAYNMYLLGIFASTIRSLLFNLFMLSIGVSIGMGFAIIRMQNAWKDRYAYDTVLKIEHAMMKRGIVDKQISQLLAELKEKQIRLPIAKDNCHSVLHSR